MASFNVDVILKARDEAAPVVKQLVGLTKQLADRRKLLTKYTLSATKATRALAIATVRANVALEKALPGMGKLVAETERLNHSTRSLGIARRGLIGDTRQLVTETKRLNAATQRGAGARGGGRPGAGAGRGGGRRRQPQPDQWLHDFRSYGGGAANVAGMMGSGITRASQAASRGLFDVMAVGADFERSMSEVLAFGGPGFADYMGALREQARTLGRTTEFKSSDAAHAMRQLTQAGMGPEQILASLPDILNAALAGATDLSTASRIVSASMAQFSSEGVTAQQVADVLATGTNLTQASFLNFGQSLQYVGGAAADAKVSFADTIKLLSMMGKSALNSGRAGTSLNAMLTKLSDVASPADNSLKSLLRRTKTSEVAFKALLDEGRHIEALQVLVANMDESGMSPTEQQKRIKMTLGERGARAFMSIAEVLRSPDDAAKITTGVDSSTGAAAGMAAKMKDNMTGSAREFASAVEDAQISIAEGLTPVIRPMVDDATKMVVAFSGWVQENRDFLKEWGPLIVKMTVAGRVLGPILSAGASFMRFGKEVVPLAARLSEATGTTRLAQGRLAASMRKNVWGSLGMIAGAAAFGVAIGTMADEAFGISNYIAGLKGGQTDIRGVASYDALTPEERAELDATKAKHAALEAEKAQLEGSTDWRSLMFGDDRELFGWNLTDARTPAVIEEEMKALQRKADELNTRGINRGKHGALPLPGAGGKPGEVRAGGQITVRVEGGTGVRATVDDVEDIPITIEQGLNAEGW